MWRPCFGKHTLVRSIEKFSRCRRLLWGRPVPQVKRRSVRPKIATPSSKACSCRFAAVEISHARLVQLSRGGRGEARCQCGAAAPRICQRGTSTSNSKPFSA
jgi:hypothetical protein